MHNLAEMCDFFQSCFLLFPSSDIYLTLLDFFYLLYHPSTAVQFTHRDRKNKNTP